MKKNLYVILFLIMNSILFSQDIFISSSQLNQFAPDIFDEEKFDVVIHLASQNCQEEAEEDPVDDAAVNILGALHILDNAKRIGAKKVIMASSKADEGQESFNEVSKLAAENYCKLYEKLYGMGCTVLRFAKKREEEACARAILACIS